MADGRALEPSDFQGVTLEQMRDWVESGAGTDSLYGKGDGWKSEDDFMRGLAEEVRQRMARAEVAIESRSGEAMQNAVAPAVLWTEIAADNAAAQAQRLHEQGDAFGRVHSAVPKKAEEAPIPDDCWLEEQWDSLVHGRTDAEAAKARNEQLRQEAVTAFTGYDDTSRGTVAASAVFTSPPSDGVDIAVGSGPHTPVSPFLPPPRPGEPADTTQSWTEHPGHNEHPLPARPAVTNPTSDTSPVPIDRTPHRDVPEPRQPQTWAATTTAQEAGGPSGGSKGNGTPGRTGRDDAGGTERGAGDTTNRRGGSVPGRGLGDSGGGTGRRGSVPSPGGSGGVGGSPATGTSTGSGSNTGGRGGAAGGAGTTGRSARDDRKDEEDEHYTPEFLKADHGFFDADLPKVAPPVFGDEDRR